MILWQTKRIVFLSAAACLFWGMTGFSGHIVHSVGAAEYPSVVPPQEHISDFDARWAMARALSYSQQTLKAALDQYRKLIRVNPQMREVQLEAITVHIRAGDRRTAAAKLEAFQDSRLTPPDRFQIARLYQELGHFRAARNVLPDLSQALGGGQALIQAADLMQGWGAFYQAEALYRRYLTSASSDAAVYYKLARLLVSTDRYEEAESLYCRLLNDHTRPREALSGLIALKIKQRKFDPALTYCDQLLELSPDSAQALFLKAQVLAERRQFEEALVIYRSLVASSLPGEQVRALLECGRVYLQQDAVDKAQAVFRQAVTLAPENIAARFWAAGQETVGTRSFCDDVIRQEKNNPERLVKWGRLYNQEQHYHTAERCFRAVLQTDPGHFPGRLQLAETLAYQKQYRKAFQQLDELARDFPENYKLMITRARILSWGRDYAEARSVYTRLHENNPRDPVPVKEMARTAVWAKNMDQARDDYTRLLTPAVDKQLLTLLEPLVSASDKTGFLQAVVDRLRDQVDTGSIWEGFADFQQTMPDLLRSSLDASRKRRIEEIRLRLWTDFLVQRTVSLERDAKQYTWDGRLIHARSAYQELVRMQPANREALFDLGQVECRLGLCDRTAERYEIFTAGDFSHTRARQALQKMDIRHHPGLAAGYSYWAEDGYGELAGIRKHHHSLALDIPLDCRMNLAFKARRWVEQGDFHHLTARASGGTMGVSGQVTAWFGLAAEWTRKNYSQSRFDDETFGSGKLWFNLYDYARLELGYQNQSELYNTFGLQQGIEADTWWLGIQSSPLRKLDLSATLRTKKYSDDNRARHHDFSVGYRFSEHPRILKLIANGQYRDMDQDNRFIYDGPVLQNIIHPYWCPEDYTAGSLVLEWRHDISEQYFCGNEQHFYDIRVGMGSDSNQNLAANCEITWHYEFRKRWTAEINALLHQSEDWDALGGWAILARRF